MPEQDAPKIEPGRGRLVYDKAQRTIVSVPKGDAQPRVADNDSGAWQPIETAPKDGTKIDLWHPTKGRLENAFYQAQTYALYEPWGWSNPWWGRITGATHWMPLPARPHTSDDPGQSSSGPCPE